MIFRLFAQCCLFIVCMKHENVEGIVSNNQKLNKAYLLRWISLFSYGCNKQTLGLERWLRG